MVVDPVACIAAMRPMLASSVSTAAELVVEIAPDLSPVWIDENEFELALINLVLNARDAVSHEDTITVSARNAGPASDTATDFLVLRKPYLPVDLRRAIAQVTSGAAVGRM